MKGFRSIILIIPIMFVGCSADVDVYSTINSPVKPQGGGDTYIPEPSPSPEPEVSPEPSPSPTPTAHVCPFFDMKLNGQGHSDPEQTYYMCPNDWENQGYLGDPQYVGVGPADYPETFAFFEDGTGYHTHTYYNPGSTEFVPRQYRVTTEYDRWRPIWMAEHNLCTIIVDEEGQSGGTWTEMAYFKSPQLNVDNDLIAFQWILRASGASSTWPRVNFSECVLVEGRGTVYAYIPNGW